MWEDILQEVIDLKMQFGDQINPGATDEDMKKWLLACRTELNKEIPDEYLQFLKKINGIEFDGFILYGIGSVASSSYYSLLFRIKFFII